MATAKAKSKAKPAAKAKTATKPAAKASVKGSGDGTKAKPWKLKTPPGTSEYQMYRADDADTPAIVCVIFSFRRTSGPVFQPGFGLQSYERVFTTVSAPIWNTLAYSAAAVAAIVVAGTLIGYLITRRPRPATAALDAILMVPYIVPGIVMGIALLTRFNGPPLDIAGTGLVIVPTLSRM